MPHSHPYLDLPDRSFWSRSVSRHWDPQTIFDKGPVLKASDLIISAGSCFAANIVGPIESAGFNYLRTERLFDLDQGDDADRFGYANYSAAYGNIYTSRQLLQLLRRSLGQFKPKEDCWLVDGVCVDPYRPGLPYPASSREEFDILTASHLSKVREAFEQATLLFFTLGLTECWFSQDDGAVFPVCPGTIAGKFDANRHRFKNMSVAEVCDDLDRFIAELAAINPNCRVVLTVSPIPLVATMSADHIATANSYSKAVLRIACAETEKKFANVMYFPAYELFVGPQAEHFYKPDKRNIAQSGIDAVMRVLLAHSEPGPGRRPEPPEQGQSAQAMSNLLVNQECEEMMQDPRYKRPDER